MNVVIGKHESKMVGVSGGEIRVRRESEDKKAREIGLTFVREAYGLFGIGLDQIHATAPTPYASFYSFIATATLVT